MFRSNLLRSSILPLPQVGTRVPIRNAVWVRVACRAVLAGLCAIAWAGLSSAQVLPIAGSGYNENMVVPAGQSFPGGITATMDGGTSLSNNTWYQVGQNSSAPSTGLPLGMSFTVGSPTTGADTFQFQGAGTNNTILLAGDGNGPTSATFTLSQPAAYNTFSFLASNGNGSGNVGLTFNFVGGGTYTTTVDIGDWFSNGANTAYDANGRIGSGGYSNVNGGDPRLYYYDVTGVPSGQQLQSISLSFQGGGSTHTAIMGISGVLASPINWSAAQTISGASDISTLGLQDYAYTENSSATVNGVAFTGLNGANHSGENPPNMTTTGFSGNYNGYGPGPASYNGIVSSGIYNDASSGNGIGSVGLNNLTAGHQYLVQYWVNDARGGAGGSNRAVTLSSPTGNSVSLSYGVAGVGYGQFGTGTFTAAGSTATIVVNGNSQDVQMNALQVRDFTNIGYWSGTAGATWDTNTTSNFGINAYTAPAAFGTFTQATSATQNAYFGDYYYNSGSTVAVGTGSVTVAAGGVSTGTVNFINNAVNYTVTSPDTNGISGSTAINVSGGGLVTLAGSHSYTGATTISAGTLQLGTGVSGQDGSIANTSTVTNNGALVYNLAGTQSAAYAITGIGSLTMSGTGTQVLGSLSNPTAASGSTFTGDITINGGTLIGAAASVHSTSGPFGEGSNSRTITVNAGGTLQFDAPNVFSSGYYGSFNVPTLNVNGGVVTNGDPAATGKVNNPLNNVNLTGGTLTATVGQHPNGYAAGYGAWNINGIITSSGNSVISTTDPVYGTTMLTNGAAANGVTTFNVQNGTLLVSAPLSEDITDGEVSGLNQTGAGTMVLTATNTFTGNATVSGGTLQLGDGVAKNGTVMANIVNNSTVVFANPAAQLFNGMVSGSGNLVKTGPGALTIAASQTYSGPTLIAGGTMKLSPVAYVPGFGEDTIGSGSSPEWTINTNNVGTTAVTNNVLTLTDGNTNEGRTAFFNTPVLTTAPFTVNFVYQGLGSADGSAFVLQNDSRGAAAIGDPGGDLSYAGANPIVNSVGVGFDIHNNGLYFLNDGSLGSLMSTGGVNINSTDPIAVTLSYDGASNIAITLVDQENNNTFMTTDSLGASIASIVGSNAAYLGFTGATGGSASTQTIGNFSTSLTYAASNILPATTDLTVAPAAKLDLNGASQTIGSLSGAGSVTNSGAAPVALTVGDSLNTTFSGNISDGSGGLSLTIAGPGELVLTGTNGYSGGTTVNGGMLVVADPAAIQSDTNLYVGDPTSLLQFSPLIPAESSPGAIAHAAAAAVPEPGTLALVAAACMAGIGARRRKRLVPRR